MKPFAALVVVGLFVIGASARNPEPSVSRIDPPAAAGAMAPNLVALDDGFLLSWLEPTTPGARPGEGDWALRFSRLRGRTWEKPRTVVAGPDFFVNWADFPSIASSRGNLLAHWAAISGPGKYAYGVELARSGDGGATWRRIGKAHDDDATESEHGFVSLLPEAGGIRAFWLDGRHMKAAAEGAHDGGGDMALYTASVNERAGAGQMLDARTCECCQTSAAMTSSGPVIVYRDRSPGEIRDIAIVRRIHGRWTKPAPVHADGWKVEGCPVNGPSVAASRSRLAVAWFTAAQDRPRVLVAFSEDAGVSFGKAAELDAREPLGRVDVALDGRGSAVVSWVGKHAGKYAIFLRRVSPDLAMGEPLAIAATTADRSSGFPRLENGRGNLLIGWVETEETMRLRAAMLSEERIPSAGRARTR